MTNTQSGAPKITNYKQQAGQNGCMCTGNEIKRGSQCAENHYPTVHVCGSI